jgi:probable F420-dependent oxidoreductase
MVSEWRARMGPIGVWSAELRFGDQDRASEAAAELDRLGYGALWVPGGIGGDILETMDRLVDATERVVVASAILNVWKHEPAEVGAWWAGESAERRERLMLGLGVSHGPLIGEQYAKPLAVMRAYIGALNAAGVDRDHLCVAAFGPKMLALSRDLTAGAHPYLVTPEHTAEARALLGPEALLAPGQAVALETDPARARQIARGALSVYLPMPNYIASWKRQGFTDEDVATASDRLCDALVAWGDIDQIARRVRAHLDAGADHVCVKVVRGAPGGNASELLDSWRALAGALF